MQKSFYADVECIHMCIGYTYVKFDSVDDFPIKCINPNWMVIFLGIFFCT